MHQSFFIPFSNFTFQLGISFFRSGLGLSPVNSEKQQSSLRWVRGPANTRRHR